MTPIHLSHITLPMFAAGLLLIGVPTAIMLAAAIHKLRPAHVIAARRRLPMRSLWQDRSGTATIEFTLVFPILLFLIMLLTQSTLLMGATMVCNHAAFAATRSAIVMIPSDQTQWSEPANTLLAADDSSKARRIHNAAAMALIPIAGRLESSENQPAVQSLVNGMNRYYEDHQRQAPQWVDTLLAERYHYAYVNTRVEVLITRVTGHQLLLEPVRGVYTFGPRDPVTVRVTHRMNLAVPYVGLIFADGRHDASSSTGSSLYANIVSQCTLPNAGIVNRLPSRPELNRIP